MKTDEHITTTMVLVATPPAIPEAVRHDATRLYLDAFATGMRGETRASLLERAWYTARDFPRRFDRIALIIDAPDTLADQDRRDLHSMAIALATRDVLRMCANHVYELSAGGTFAGGLIRPGGGVDPDEALNFARLSEPQALFVITGRRDYAANGPGPAAIAECPVRTLRSPEDLAAVCRRDLATESSL